MKRANRVRKHKDFDRIITHSQPVKGRYFSIFHERGDVDETHIGIAVGKNNGGAVARVRLKRQVRAMVNEIWTDWAIPLNLIIVIRPSYKQDCFHDGKRELADSLGKVLSNIGK